MEICNFTMRKKIHLNLLFFLQETFINMSPNPTKSSKIYRLFKALALWADAFYKLICPYVCVSVCVSLCVSVCLFTF